MSEQVKLGKVAMTLGGDYNSSQSYDKLTCVQFDGCSWVSKKQVPEGVAPTPANSAYWQKISDRGLQGATGAPGQSYVDKELVPIVNDLTTGGSANVLSAEQGKILDTKLATLAGELIEIHETLYGFDEQPITSSGYIGTSPYVEPIDVSKVTATTGYMHKVVECSVGDAFKIVGLGGGTPRLWAFINEDGYLCGDEGVGYASESEVTEGKIIVAPAGAAHLVVNYNIDNRPEGNALYKIDSSFKSVNKIRYRYTPESKELLVASIKNGQPFVYKLRQNPGYNKLYDFEGYYIITLEEFITCDFSNMRVLYHAGSDQHSPFIVNAVNNADGDGGVTANQWTGGTHDYSNGKGTGTPTARMRSLNIWVDGVALDLYKFSEGSCSKIDVSWVNMVQGANTIKKDGTGREILQETHRMSFDGNKFIDDIELMPLEDVQMLVWYALQIIGTANYWTHVRYYDAINRRTNVGTTASNSGGKDCSEVCAFVNADGTGHYLRMGIDTTFDLGKRTLLIGSGIGADVRTYGKAYMNIINDASMLQGEHYNLRGFWEVGKA